MEKIFIWAAVVLASSSAWASLSIDCGKIDHDGTVPHPFLTVASEDEQFSGAPSDRTWTLIYKGQDYAGKKNASAKFIRLKNGDKGILVQLTFSKDSGKRVGEDLVIANPYSDNPTLSVYTIDADGKSGPKTYRCVGSQD
jgi:hypothetical protein